MRRPELLPLAATFATVVREGGIRGAARTLGCSKATIARQIDALERALGVRLLERTTRQVRATAEGEAFFAELQQVDRAWTSTLSRVDIARGEPSGTLRVTAPEIVTAGLILPVVARLLERYADLDVDLLVQDHMLNLVTEQIDVAIRAGPMPDSSHHVVRLAHTKERVYGSPELAATLDVADPFAVEAAPWVVHTALPIPPQRVLIHDDGTEVKLTPRIRARTISSACLLTFVERGTGLAPIPRLFVREQLAKGALVELPWSGRDVSLNAVFVGGEFAAPRVRAFVDTMRAFLQS